MRILFACSLCVMASVAIGADWYVRPGGAGTRSGVDWNNAWDSSGMLRSNVNAGDTVWMAGGSYGTRPVVVSRSGTQASPIVVKRVTSADVTPTSAAGWSSSFDSVVTIGPVNGAWQYTTVYYLGSNMILDGRTNGGIHLINANNAAPPYYPGAFYFVYGSGGQSNILVANVDIDGGFNATNNTPNNNVQGVSFYHPSTDPPYGLGIMFSNCWIHSCNDNIFISGVPNGLTFYQCKIYDNQYSSGSYHGNVGNILNSSNIVFSRCEFTGWTVEGFEIYGNFGTLTFDSCLIHDSIGNVASFLWPAGTFNTSGSQGPVFLYGNTFVNLNGITTAQGGNIPFNSASAATNNIYWNAPWYSGSIITNSDFNFSDVSTPGSGSISSGSNPFVDYAGGNYSIVSNVGALYPKDKGFTLPPTYRTDFAGNLRGADGAWDIGAYEFSGSIGGTAPSISAQPQNQTVTVGQSATFSVTASGTATLAYQWSRNGANIAGATQSTYTFNNAQLSDSGSAFTVGVTNSYGGAASSTAFLTVITPSGATFYVSPSGSSGNSGTSAGSPWPLAYALANVSPSNTIIFLPGSYPSIDLSDTTRHVGLNLQSQTKWAARITASTNMHGIATEVGVSNVVIDGFHIDTPWISGVKLNDQNSTVRNCWINNAAQGNPAWQYNTNDTFEGSGIEAHNKIGTLIEKNLIEYCGAWSNHDHGVYINGTNCIIRGNVFRYNLAHAVQVYETAPQAASNIQIYDNLAYGNGRGIVVYSQTGCTNPVFGNTIISTNAAPESTPILVRRYAGVTATNNICQGTGYSIGSDDGTGFFEDYNIVSTSVGGPHDIVTSTPGFVNTSKGLYWLLSTSAARGAALSGVYGPVNFFGSAQSSVVDIGAFQYAAAFAQDSRTLDPSSPTGADYWIVLRPISGTAFVKKLNAKENHSAAAPSP